MSDIYIHYNGNPCGLNTGDCVIRAIEIATGMTWSKVYCGLCVQGYFECGFGNFNRVWSNYLQNLGYTRYELPENDEYTIADFANDHKYGVYIIGTGSHAVCVVNGDIVDSWDSSGQIPRYYFKKE